MKLIKPILLAGVIIALVYSCKKKEETPSDNTGGSNKTKLELLTQNNWKISALVSSGTDIWNLLVEPCNKDNEYHFRKDDSLVLYDMATKCNVSDPDSTLSLYKLYNNNTQLILNVKLTNSATLNDTADIIEITESSLKLNAQYSGIPATISFTHP